MDSHNNHASQSLQASVQHSEAFMQAMRDAGIEPPEFVIADGTLHRFHVYGDKAGSKNGWYIFYDDGMAAGAYGCWKRGISEDWSNKEHQSLTTEERARIAARIESIRKQRAAEKKRMYAECRAKCKELWDKGHDVDAKHSYVVAKGIKPVGIRQLKDLLLVPVRDFAGKIHGLQFIGPDGTKNFKTGTLKEGNFCSIPGDKDGPVLICEGYATGASLHEVTGYSVVIAFDAGNLAAVATLMRNRLSRKRRLIVCADNDQWTEGNPGLSKATLAAREARAFLAAPAFQDTETKPTDFNDLCKLEGIEAVRRCIDNAVYCRAVISADEALAKMGLSEHTAAVVA